jgi:hypothetical protein
LNNTKLLKNQDIRDLVCEGILLREFSPYGCETKPGRTYGYNPFSKKCVDITDYEGPEKPDSIAGQKKKKEKTVGKAPLGDTAEAIADGIFNSLSLEEIKKCYKNNTWASGLGLFFNAEAAFIGRKALGLVYSVATLPTPIGKNKQGKIINNQVADDIARAEREAFERLSGWQKASRRIAGAPKGFFTLLKLAKAINVTKLAAIGGLAALTYGGAMAGDAMAGPTSERYFGMGNWKKSLDNLFLTYLDPRNIELKSISCFITAAVVGRSLRHVLVNTLPVAKATGGLIKDSVVQATVRRQLAAAIKKVNTPELNKFSALKGSQWLPRGTTIKIGTNGKLVISPSLPGRIEIPLNTPTGKALKKYATGDKVVFDPNALAKELDDISEEAFKISEDFLAKEINIFKESDVAKQLRNVIKMGPTGNPAIRSSILSNSSDTIKAILESSEAAVKEFAKSTDELKVLEANMPNILKNGQPEELLKRMKTMAVTTSDSISDIAKTDGFFKRPETLKYLEDYLTAHKKAKTLEKGLVEDFAKASAIFNSKQNAFFQTLTKKGKATKIVSDFLLTGPGNAYKGMWNSLPRRFNDMRGKLSGFSDAQKALDNLYMPGSMILAVPALSLGVQFVMELNRIEELETIAYEVFKDFKAENYTKENIDPTKVEIDISKLFNDFNQKVQNSDFYPDGKKKVKRVNEELKNKESSAYKKFDEEINSSDANAFNLQNSFLRIVRSAFSAKEEKQNEGVTVMTSKKLSDLVREVLNENSGMGYGKYPYGNMHGEDEEPKADYIEEWKSLSMEVIRDESRDTAIQIAKILVRDLELFEDVLDLAGQNQSVGTEILTKLKQIKEKA